MTVASSPDRSAEWAGLRAAVGEGRSVAAAYYPPNEQLEVFFLDGNGALNVLWKAQGEPWHSAVALTAPGFAPPGAPLAAAYYPLNEQLEVFTVGGDGAVKGIWKAQNSPWRPPFTLTGGGFAPPGAHLAAAFYPPNNQLELFVVDRDGTVNVIWKAQNGAWNPPVGLQAGFGAPGAPLAVAYQPLNEQLEVFAVGDDGSVRGIWKEHNGAWKPPLFPAPAGFAPSAAHITGAFYPPNNQVELFVVDRDGTVNVIWKAQNGAWNPPVGLQAGFGEPGGPLTVAYQPLNEQLEVFAVGDDGSVRGIWKEHNGAWKPPFFPAPAGFAASGSSLAAAFYPGQAELALVTTDGAGDVKLMWKLQNRAWAACPTALQGGTNAVVCDQGPLTEIPEHLRPGTHTLVLQVGRSLQAFDSRALSDSCTLAPGPGPAQDFWVGWGQLELTNSDPCHASVVETAVLFDTGPLDEVPVKDINRAVLTYDEAEGQGCYVTEAFGVRQIPCWRSGTGFSQQKPAGCVGALRMPTVDWINDAPPGLIPYITPPGVRRLTPREWDVSEDYRDQYTRRAPLGGSALPPFGFLLAGGPSLDDLSGEDSTSCYSWISNIRLHLTYTVPPDGGSPPVVR
ncbi:MAG: hypothetical protein M3N68_02100 [Actinomycetota bacterium]|nr:hypothetical protein [Actinomycetota bacterium]